MQAKSPSFTTSKASSQTNEPLSSWCDLENLEIATEDEPTSPSSRKKCFDTETCLCCACGLVLVVVIGLVIWVIVSSDGNGGGRIGGVFFGGGGGGYGSCFPAGELVLLADLSESPIEQLQAGSFIHGGGRITAVMKLAHDKKDPIYRYNDSVFVTGSHLVREEDEWKPVDESSLAVRRADKSPHFVYNLIGSKHGIVINETTFADWEDEEDWEDDGGDNWALESAILNRLNDGLTDVQVPRLPATEVITEGAFEASTPILLYNGTAVGIDEVLPGDQLDGIDNIVFAVMQVWIPDDTTVYCYKNSTLATEWTIVLDDDGFWRNVKHSPNAVAVGPASASQHSAWYQLWTTTHQVPTDGNLIFVDYHVLDEDDPLFDEL